jgi:hypothetical protein
MTLPATPLTPGLYTDMPEDAYHADPCPEPSLSSSVAKLLIDRSPRHAWFAHPRLNPEHEAENKTAYDLGRAVHKVLLGKGSDLVPHDFDDYRSKAAQETRDAAYAAGRTPLKPAEWERVQAVAKAAEAQIILNDDLKALRQFGAAEQTLIWRDEAHGIWCRARLDWMPNAGNVFVDLKTTSASANPEEFTRRGLFDLGYDVQAAFYRRGIEAVLGIPDARFVFGVVELAAPHAMSAISLRGSAMAMADAKVDYAMGLWSWCLRNRAWPGYPRHTAEVFEAPPWHEKRFAERADRAQIAAEQGEDMRRMLMDWQAPIRTAAAE